MFIGQDVKFLCRPPTLKMMASQVNVIEQPEGISGSKEEARDELMPVVYNELRRLAEVYLRYERDNHTLQPTALVHEAYLRLIEQKNVKWQNREHFIGVAATMMRRVLVNYAVMRNCEKRGGGEVKLSLIEADRFIKGEDVNLIDLDKALERLAESYPLHSRTVELKFFGGLSIEETARVLNVSDSTIERYWRFARAWLARELKGEAHRKND